MTITFQRNASHLRTTVYRLVDVPTTTGRVIRLAGGYDRLISYLTFEGGRVEPFPMWCKEAQYDGTEEGEREAVARIARVVAAVGPDEPIEFVEDDDFIEEDAE